MSEHLSLHSIQWFLHCFGHIRMGTDLQQDDGVCQWVYLDVCSQNADFEGFDSNGLHSLCHYAILSPAVGVLSLTLQFCLDRFTTWCTILELCCNVCNSHSPNQLLLYTSVCHCVYRVKQAAAPATPAQQPPEQISVVHVAYISWKDRTVQLVAFLNYAPENCRYEVWLTAVIKDFTKKQNLKWLGSWAYPTSHTVGSRRSFPRPKVVKAWCRLIIYNMCNGKLYPYSLPPFPIFILCPPWLPFIIFSISKTNVSVPTAHSSQPDKSPVVLLMSLTL